MIVEGSEGEELEAMLSRVDVRVAVPMKIQILQGEDKMRFYTCIFLRIFTF